MLARAYRKALITVGGNTRVLRSLAFLWRAFPYPARRLVTHLFIRFTLLEKRLLKVDLQDAITPMDELGNLAYWGIPRIEKRDFRLNIDGAVGQPLCFSFDSIEELPKAERLVRMDCVGGFRNNSVMAGVPVDQLLRRAEVLPDAQRAVFHCADGYFVSVDLQDLRDKEAFLAYSVNGQEVPRLGFPLRLAIPGKYGYQWAKWVVRVEVVTDQRKGYWAELGLPDRGDIGDTW